MPSKEDIIREIADFERRAAELARPATPHDRGQRVVYETLAAHGRRLLARLGDDTQARRRHVPPAPGDED